MKLGESALTAALLLPSASAQWFRGGGSAAAEAEVKKAPAVDVPVHRSLQDLSGLFNPLSCNSNLDAETCTQWSFGETVDGEVVIPCGTCVTMSVFTAGQTVTVGGGINILGRLDFPEGTKVNVETPNIFVQGKLSMSLTTGPIGGTPDVKITMTGTNDQFLIPHIENVGVCLDGGCNVGPKAIVVAGGALDINAMDDTCPTWSDVLDYTDAGMPNPSFGVPSHVSPPLETCASSLISAFFDDPNLGNGGLDGWYGNLGAEESIESGSHDGSSYLKISRRTDTWQGPYREMRRGVEKPCLQSDATYFFRAKIKLSDSPDHPGHVSQCSQTGDNCPKLRFQYMGADDFVSWNDLVAPHPGFVAPADGTWYDLEGYFSLDIGWVDPTNVFTTVSINGPEKEVDISVDDVVIELAPADAFPDPNNVCSNLFINGAADKFNGVPFPFHSYISSADKAVYVKDPGDGNPAFYMTGRYKQFDTISMDLPTGCLVPDSLYTFSARIRVDSPVDVTPRLTIKTHKDGQDPSLNRPNFDCPKTSAALGWSTCTVDFTWQQKHYDADRVEMLIMLLSTDETSDAYFDDLSFTFKSGLTSGGIQLDSAVTSQCYAAGAEAMVPSNDLLYDRAQEVTLSSVDGAGLVEVAENTFRLPTTAARDARFAGQFAFLSRRVEFDGDGGTLTVLGTAGAQRIQGAAFVGFGQGGELGRTPIAFTQAGDVTGSVLAKNAIRNSNNRCVHLYGTNNLSVSENVAYNTQGHCYALYGSETGNTFTKNLGAVTKKATDAIAGESDDTHPATFYISAAANSFVDNVAGGSQGFGYLINPSTQDALSSFTGNVAHSNAVAGIETSSSGYNPTSPSTFANTRSFRNTGQGVRLQLSSNIVLAGGTIADNRNGVEVWKSDAITVEDMAIIGQTDIYKDLASFVPNTPALCNGFATGPSVAGVRVHPNGGAAGVTVSAVEFSGFTSDSGCEPSSGDTAAIALVSDDPALTASFTTSITVTGLTFEAGSDSENEVKLCGAAGRGIYDVTITDTDGSLNPAGPGTGGGVISESMTCTTGIVPMAGACANYCTGTVGAGTPPAPGPAGASSLSGPAGTATTCIQNGNFENGLSSWYGGPPVDVDVTPTVAVSLVPGKDGGQAALSTDRTVSSLSGVWQDLNQFCMEIDEWYEVRADVKVTMRGTDTPFQCDPSVMWFGVGTSCPFFTLLLDPDGDALRRIDVGATIGPVDNTVGAWNRIYGAFKVTTEIANAGNFPIIIANAPNNVDITVDNVAIDHVSTDNIAGSVGAVECSSPIVNGDFETGDLTGWFIRGTGEGGSLSLVAGYGGTGYAVRHENRPAGTKRWHGILQQIPMECFVAGSTWTITARFRFFDPTGTAVVCDKADQLANDSCPTFELGAGGQVLSRPLTNTDPGDAIAGEWNVISNTYTIPSTMTLLGARDMWLTINSVPPEHIYEIDDVVMTQAASSS